MFSFSSDRKDSEPVGANSKSQKKINESSKGRKNTSRERESSSSEMTQTERTRKTKKAMKNDSDREHDQILKIAPSSKSISKAKNSKGNVCLNVYCLFEKLVELILMSNLQKRSSFCVTNIARETLQSNQRSSSGVGMILSDMYIMKHIRYS